MITRRHFALGASAFGAAAARFARAAHPKKNVLWFLSDQHKRDCLGVAGAPGARTPNGDALARGSMRFTGAYCTNPVCTPSRASLLTGLYTHNHQTWNNSTPWTIEPTTIAHHFGRAGDVTGLSG